MSETRELKIPALEIRQGPNRVLYSFAVDGKALPSFATISRIRRNDGSEISGYQRPEVLSHIGEIRRYVESEDPMVPNAIVVAFDKRVSFQPLEKQKRNSAHSRHGMLNIPIDESLPDYEKPGWIVDGQQRVAAIRQAQVDCFPICVIGFISGTEQEQREQFILVNSAKPLPKGLIYELLPSTNSTLPSLLERRRFPAALMERLNFDEDSSLRHMIRMPTCPEGVMKDNSILKMIENSLNDGVLYRFRDPSTGEGDIKAMLAVLKDFWGAVKGVFKDAWGLPPRRSRLMHGAGIVSLGFIMDAIADRHRREGLPNQAQFEEDLEPLREVCRWTDGYWDFGPGAQRKWNEIQNIHRDIQLLANYLLGQYKSLVWNRPMRNKLPNN